MFTQDQILLAFGDKQWVVFAEETAKRSVWWADPADECCEHRAASKTPEEEVMGQSWRALVTDRSKML